MTMTNTEVDIKVGNIIEGEVFKITRFGAFVKLSNDKKGLIHISQISDEYVQDISKHLNINDKVKARIVAVDGSKIDLTLKKAKEQTTSSYPKDRGFKTSELGEKLNDLLANR